MVGAWIWGKDKTVLGPLTGSWFHIIWLVICIISTFLVVYFLSSKHDKKLELLITRIIAIVFFSLELTYQIMTIVYNGSFKARVLPFNFCSLPIFTTAISSFLNEKHSKVKNTIDSISILFCLMGGICMMIMPGYALKTPYVLRSLHTMLWHTLLVVYGFYMFFSKELYKEFKLKRFIPLGCIVFGIILLGAILSEVVYFCYLKPNGIPVTVDSANYYFASNHFKSPIPVLNLLQGKIPYPVYLLLFFISFMGVVILLKYLSYLIYSLINKHCLSNKKEIKPTKKSLKKHK